ncbi:GDSL-type esterase/lipase family protein [Dactylosporangium darangshiense]|uniref:GDSL-type esterase/lipase family protein n=1 Tax=Dactylosporangium darangshiense TaxID=579108 RepID=UPI00362724D4
MNLQSERARRIATAAVVGGGGVAGASVLFYGVVLGQALMARKTIPQVVSPPPRADGIFGTQFEGEPIRLVVLGDSSAAGYGAEHPSETFAAAVAAGLAEQQQRPVRMRCLAVVGAESKGLPPQVDVALRQKPDIAVICVGGNDVTHRVRVQTAVQHLVDAVRRLRAAGVEVVVGTCPDLGTIRPIQPRCAGWPGAGAARWPPRRRSPSSRPAAARCRSATCWASCSTPSRTACSASTASTPPAPATSPRPRPSCPRSWRRWRSPPRPACR